MIDVLVSNARILTLRGSSAPRTGTQLNDLAIIEHGWLRTEGTKIAAIGDGEPDANARAGATHIDARRRVLMPGFVDCHTHACWAGERYDEFEMKLNGATYLDILKSGGGIMATVRAVRDATTAELKSSLLMRLQRMARLGTVAAEIKTGYGLQTDAECKMLRAIIDVAHDTPMRTTPTFLGAHAIDAENPNFIHETIEETLPAVLQMAPNITCDAYCEEGAWSLDETTRLFQAAQAGGCPLRVHADQFNALGMTTRAIEMGATSVDHLEASTADELRLLARSETFGVMLPCSGFQVDQRYADAQMFLKDGGKLALATNYNPGSAPSPSMPFTIALACRVLGMTHTQAILCTTQNPACLLGIEETNGRLEVGMDASFQLLDCTDERELAYEFATPGPALVAIRGTIHHRGTDLD